MTFPENFHEFSRKLGVEVLKNHQKIPVHLNKICNMQNVKQYEGECAAGRFLEKLDI
jgi:hypothetical protein